MHASKVPLIVDGSVHLGLQLVGASADGPAVTASTLGARVLLKVLQERKRGEGGGRGRRQNLVGVSASTEVACDHK